MRFNPVNDFTFFSSLSCINVLSLLYPNFPSPPNCHDIQTVDCKTWHNYVENATAPTIKRFAHCRIKDNPTAVSSEDNKKSISRQSGRFKLSFSTHSLSSINSKGFLHIQQFSCLLTRIAAIGMPQCTLKS